MAIILDDILSSTMSVFTYTKLITNFVFEGFQYVSILF